MSESVGAARETPLQGWGVVWMITRAALVTLALPWAMELRPLGPEGRKRSGQLAARVVISESGIGAARETPLQGWGVVWMIPRAALVTLALPWAMELRPFGPERRVVL